MQAHLRRSTVRFFRSAHGHAETQRASDGMRKHLRWLACSPPPAHQLCGTGEPINTLDNFSSMNESPASAELLLRKLKPGGVLHCATDWEHYAEHVLAVMAATPGFRYAAGAHRYTQRPNHRPPTKFERRGERLGHVIRDLVFVRE